MEADNDLQFRGQLIVPDSMELRRDILEEAQNYQYSVYQGKAKM